MAIKIFYIWKADVCYSEYFVITHISAACTHTPLRYFHQITLILIINVAGCIELAGEILAYMKGGGDINFLNTLELDLFSVKTNQNSGSLTIIPHLVLRNFTS